jgi:fibronectin type 3 domain-containing protein
MRKLILFVALLLPAQPTHYVQLTWSAGEAGGAADYFLIYRGAPGSYALLTYVPITTTSYRDATGIAGTEYCYSIIAYDSVSKLSSPASKVACVVAQ